MDVNNPLTTKILIKLSIRKYRYITITTIRFKGKMKINSVCTATFYKKKILWFLKRVFDIQLSVFFIVILMPVWLIFIYIITRDGGTAIYSHERIGLNGRRFKCYKLRSMVLNSDDVLRQLLETDRDAREEWEKNFKLRNDPRITRIGHFIRRTSLDELPQLFNVLRGEMSLVGPRPIVQEELERYGANAKYYLAVRPGITGLWQVSGRNDVSYQERIQMDVHYVINWTFLQDLLILLKTVFVVCVRKGAY